MTLVRSRYQDPSHADGGGKAPINNYFQIRLRHPAYDDTTNILLVFPGLDHCDGGIHHGTARMACAIIANNRWNGFLTDTRDGERMDIEDNGILRGEDYYFRVGPDADGKSSSRA